jgi:DNA-binding transcriptional LysR family regulator
MSRLGVWGAPNYFRTHKRPRTPSDLLQHRFALFNEPPLRDDWVFERNRERTNIRLKPALVTNAGEGHVAAVSEGVTLGVIPSFLLPSDHEQLELVLPEWSLGHVGIFAVYPHRRFVPAKVRALVDFLRSALGDGNRDPWWPAAIPVPGSLRTRTRRAAGGVG